MKLDFNPFPVLTTRRLVLRMLLLTDAGDLAKLRSDEQVNRYLNRSATSNVIEAEAFIKNITELLNKNTGAYWVICLKTDPTLIGTICFWNFDLKRQTADIGYELMPAQQGKGLMQEAIKAVIKYGFSEMQLYAIIAVTHPDNSKSSKILIKNGFILDAANKFVSKEDAADEIVYVLRHKTAINI
ncbi:GNAT family N-acetyltransferase [Mucilaginibacter ximonensis]|uniref:GNAT family N-acetyltransferase n=1 Tax=Mucilaginibacter ximonensis TaxID=538021 RepID=A0ABW5YEY5_9SPHI